MNGVPAKSEILWGGEAATALRAAPQVRRPTQGAPVWGDRSL